MATNTFSNLKEASFRARPKASYTFRLPVIQTTRWQNGTKALTGYIKDVSTSALISRRAYLTLEPSGQVIAIYESDTVNAQNYFFNGLQDLTGTDESYSVAVHDKTLATAAQVKDNLTPV